MSHSSHRSCLTKRSMLDKLGKDATSKKFVKAYDKYTIALCGTALVAYGAQQYFVRASRFN